MKEKEKEKEFVPMDGYVKNVSVRWAYIFKQGVKPGGKIDLNSLYEAYGEKNSLNPGEEFVEWIKNVKLNGRDGWSVVLNNPEDYYTENISNKKVEIINKKVEKVEKEVTQTVPTSKKDKKVLKAPKDMDVSDIASLTVKEAKEVLPMINDLNTLKYALKVARPRAHTDTLCAMLDKRIREVQVLG